MLTLLRLVIYLHLLNCEIDVFDDNQGDLPFEDNRYHKLYGSAAEQGKDYSKINYDLTITNKEDKGTFFILGNRYEITSSPFLSTFKQFCKDKNDRHLVNKSFIKKLEFPKDSINIIGEKFIHKSGLYKGFVISCSSKIGVKGEISYKNKLGYLDADQLYTLFLYPGMFVMFIFFLMAELIQFWSKREQRDKTAEWNTLKVAVYLIYQAISISFRWGNAIIINRKGKINPTIFLIAKFLQFFSYGLMFILIYNVAAGNNVIYTETQPRKKRLFFCFFSLFFLFSIYSISDEYYSKTYRKKWTFTLTILGNLENTIVANLIMYLCLYISFNFVLNVKKSKRIGLGLFNVLVILLIFFSIFIKSAMGILGIFYGIASLYFVDLWKLNWMVESLWFISTIIAFNCIVLYLWHSKNSLARYSSQGSIQVDYGSSLTLNQHNRRMSRSLTRRDSLLNRRFERRD